MTFCSCPNRSFVYSLGKATLCMELGDFYIMSIERGSKICLSEVSMMSYYTDVQWLSAYENRSKKLAHWSWLLCAS
jgi:hypothetical protein